MLFVELLVLTVSLVTILALAVMGARPGDGRGRATKTGSRLLSRYREPNAGTPKLFLVFLILSFADGYSVISAGGAAGSAGAGLGLTVALMPSVELTGTILALLASAVTTISLAESLEHTDRRLATASVVGMLLMGRVIGRLVLGRAHRRPVEHIAGWLAVVSSIQFLLAPVGVTVVGDPARLGASSIVAVVVDAALAFPGVLIASLVGIGVGVVQLIGPGIGVGDDLAYRTFIVCAIAAYGAVALTINAFRRRG